MTPGNAIISDIPVLLAADAGTIASATLACKVKLVKAPFTPSPTLVPADVTVADFDGSTPITCATGAQNSGNDPLTGNYFTEMKIPVGGWRWTVSGTTNLPETIYGFVLEDNAGAIVYGSALFPTPITLSSVGQVIEIPSIRFTFLANGIQ